MSKRKLYRILIEAVVVALFIAALVFFVAFRVTKVQIEGNQYYTDEEIKKMVLDAPNAGNYFGYADQDRGKNKRCTND